MGRTTVNSVLCFWVDFTATSDGRTVDVLTVDMAAALEMLAKSKSRGQPDPLKVLGKHPEDEEQVAIFEGRYGPYVKHGTKGKRLASVPRDFDLDNVTLDLALDWIDTKQAKKGGGKKTTKKKSTRKKTTKKKSAKSAKTTAARKTKKKKPPEE